jgi:hypothetical protein
MYDSKISERKTTLISTKIETANITQNKQEKLEEMITQ